MNRTVSLFAAVMTLSSLGAPAPLQAAEKGKLATPLFEGNRQLARVSPSLLRVRELRRRGKSLAEARRSEPLLRMKDRGLEIELRFRELAKDAIERVTSLANGEPRVFSEFARIVGSFDPDVLDELAAIPGLRTIHPVYPPVRHRGSTTSQGDLSIRANLARSTYGLTGAGVQVGVLSDSFHQTIGGAASGAGCARVLTGSLPQLSGDLPSSVVVLDDGPAGGSDEGAAMSELIHDLAPGAGILFHSAAHNEPDFAQGIGELMACGADVIVDDIQYFAEPMFQDGIVAQAAETAVAQGTAYFSAAGNNSRHGVDQRFTDSNGADDDLFPASGADFHDFGGGDRFGEIVLQPGCAAGIVLQWNDPFDGTLGPGAANDLDLYVCNAADPSSCAPVGTGVQGCATGPGLRGGDPIEMVFIDNSSGSTPLSTHLAVEHYCGDQGVQLRIAVQELACHIGAGIALESSVFDDAQIYGHAAAAGVVATAAIHHAEIDSAGDQSGTPGEIDVEPFSSLGGRLAFYFDGAGAPYPGAPVLRRKPEIAAPDGGNTTFFGEDSDGDGWPNFFGTSAAAPHAAAVAALMLEANPELTPGDLVRRMRRSAIDADLAGRDALSGHGMVDALNAVTAAIELAPRSAAAIDFDGDRKTDIGVFRPATGYWYGDTNRDGAVDFAVRFGQSGDIPVPADYDGDGKTDIAVFRPRYGQWFADFDRNGTVDLYLRFGVSTDVPVPADYDGDGKADIAVFRPAIGRWWIDLGRDGTADHSIVFGANKDIPVPADFDGDGKTDVAVFRPAIGRWWIDLGRNGTADSTVVLGVSGDVPTAGDYDDDGAIDLAVFRRSTGRWYLDFGRDGTIDMSATYGANGDIAVPGDYDGDHVLDIAVFRPSSKYWFVDTDQNGTANLSRHYGLGGDVPLREFGWVQKATGLVP